MSTPTDSSSCPGDVSLPAGCTGPTGPHPALFQFGYWSCLSPEVRSILPKTGHSGTDITIIGAGFSTVACQNEVTLGGYTCVVKQASSKSLVCNLDTSSGDVPVGELLTLEVTVSNRGQALYCWSQTITGKASPSFQQLAV